MAKRMIATTDPTDEGYEYISALGGFYYCEEATIDVNEIVPIHDKYTGRVCGYELPDGTEVELWDLVDYGIYAFNEDNFDEDMDNIKETFESARYGYVASGFCGLWDGRHAGGKFIEGMKDLRSTMAGYDDVDIWDEDGDFVINMHHHDGTNVLTLREITDKGYEWWMDNDDELDRRTLVETIFNNPEYSVPPHIADRAFGTVSSSARRPQVSAMSKKSRMTKTKHSNGQIRTRKDKVPVKKPAKGRR